MDDCIARGGISHVLAQARASLKHPSRPFTPKTGSRPLFHGDDYRPTSRPSSTYSQNGAEYDKPHSPSLVASASTHTVAGRRSVSRRRESCQRANDDDDGDDSDNQDTDESLRPSKTSAAFTGPTSPLCDSARSEYAADDADDAKSRADYESKDQDEDGDDPSCYATPESLHMTLLQLQSALSDVESADAAATTVATVAKWTNQLFHDVHLLRHDDGSRASTASSVPVATTYAACLAQLLAHVDNAPEDHVIGLVHAALQLWACHLTPPTHENQHGRLVVAACKRLFMLSKDPANDDRFCQVALVETLLGVFSPKESHLVPTQVLIYVAGVLKNVSGSARMVTLLATNGAIGIFAKALEVTFDKDVNAAAQVLVQVTAILRNLAEHKQCLKQFWHAHVIQALCDLLPTYSSHGELVLNASRVLSKLTLHEAGRTQVNKGSDNLRHLLHLLDGATSSRQHDAALVIRLAFILGNLTATNDRNRKAIFTNGAVPHLMRLLTEYHIRYTGKHPDNNNLATAEDVLVKLVRLVANAAIHASVGPILGTEPGIEVLLDILDRAKAERHEELMLNVVSCLTNLSFYATDAATTNVITVHRLRLSRDLASILVEPNDEAVVEAARAFGNLSRFPDVLGAMLDAGSSLLPTFVMLLDHANRDVVYTVCGVLMNAALDQRTRGRLHAVSLPTSDGDGTVVDTRDLLVGLFRHAGLKDLAMSTMVCKVLFNLVLAAPSKQTSDATYVDTTTGRLLLTTLEELVDAMADSATEAEVDFAGVAHALMRSLVK